MKICVNVGQFEATPNFYRSPWTRLLSCDDPADASVLRDKSTVLGGHDKRDTILNVGTKIVLNIYSGKLLREANGIGNIMLRNNVRGNPVYLGTDFIFLFVYTG